MLLYAQSTEYASRSNEAIEVDWNNKNIRRVVSINETIKVLFNSTFIRETFTETLFIVSEFSTLYFQYFAILY